MNSEISRQAAPSALADIDRRSALIALSVITLLGAVLRAWGLGNESYWLDEAFSVMFSNHSPAELWSYITRDNAPPLYYLFLFMTVHLFGVAEWAGRLPSLVFGILTIPLLYRIGARLFCRRTGLVAAFLLAVSVFHHFHSQDARFYALFCLTTVLSTELFLRYLAKPRSLPLAAAWAFALVLVMYSHFLGALVVAVHGAILMVEYLRRRRCPDSPVPIAAFAVLAVPIAAFAPWTIFLMRQLGKDVSYTWIPPVTGEAVAKSFVEFSNGKYPAVLSLALAVGALAFAVYRIAQARKLSPAVFPVLYVLLWLTIPVAAIVFVSLAITPLHQDRYLIPILPAWLLLIAWAITRVRFPAIQAVILLVLMGFGTTGILRSIQTIEKERWREAAALVEAEADPGDTLLFNAYFCLQGPWRLYVTREDLNTVMMPRFERWVNDANIGEVTPAVEGLDRVWYIRCKSGDMERRIDAVLAERFPVRRHWEGNGVEVQWYGTGNAPAFPREIP